MQLLRTLPTPFASGLILLGTLGVLTALPFDAARATITHQVVVEFDPDFDPSNGTVRDGTRITGVTQTGAPEDRALAESIQRTMASEANEFFTLGHFERAIVHFHRNLEAALAESDRGGSKT